MGMGTLYISEARVSWVGIQGKVTEQHQVLTSLDMILAGVQSRVQACCSACCVQGPHPVPPGVSLPHDRFRSLETDELKSNVVGCQDRWMTKAI